MAVRLVWTAKIDRPCFGLNAAQEGSRGRLFSQPRPRLRPGHGRRTVHGQAGPLVGRPNGPRAAAERGETPRVSLGHGPISELGRFNNTDYELFYSFSEAFI